MTTRFLPVGFWGEHGAWAMALTSLGAGLVLGRPPSWQAWMLLPSAACLIGAKGLSQVTRRTERGWATLAGFALSGLALALPAAWAAPLPFAVVALVAGPFSLVYLRFADTPRWTRSLAAEVTGTLLMASAGPLAVASSRPTSPWDLLGLGASLGSLFLPGVLRARMRKDPSPGMRGLTAASALAGLALWCALVLQGLLAPWGLLGATVFLGDLWAVAALPQWRVRTLGAFFTIRYALAALILALAWHWVE